MFVTLNDGTRENGLKSFVFVKRALFEKFASIDFLGPKEFILSFAKKLSKYLVDPDKLLPDICRVQYYTKK